MALIRDAMLDDKVLVDTRTGQPRAATPAGSPPPPAPAPVQPAPLPAPASSPLSTGAYKAGPAPASPFTAKQAALPAFDVASSKATLDPAAKATAPGYDWDGALSYFNSLQGKDRARFLSEPGNIQFANMLYNQFNPASVSTAINEGNLNNAGAAALKSFAAKGGPGGYPVGGGPGGGGDRAPQPAGGPVTDGGLPGAPGAGGIVSSALSAGSILPGGAEAAGLGPVERDVQGNQTVQGQLADLLKTGNPLLEQAKARAMQQANARGLQNTSMAAQAGEEAILAAAMPIAQQDAQTYQQQALANQDIVNQFRSMQLGAGLDLNKQYESFLQAGVLQDKDNALKKYIADTSITSQEKIAALQAAVTREGQAKQFEIASMQIDGRFKELGMELDSRKLLTQMDIDARQADTIARLNNSDFANFTNGLMNLQTSQLEPEAKAAHVKQWLSVWAGNPYIGSKIDLSALITPTTATPTTTTTTGGGGDTTPDPGFSSSGS